jgi:transposase
MKHISLEAKQCIIKKALARKDHSLVEIAAANNVGYSTLQKWLRGHKNSGEEILAGNSMSSKTKLTNKERFDHVVATANFDATQIGAYCREQGFYAFELQKWKDDFMANNINNDQKIKDKNNELVSLKNENKRLKQEINRKDRALAETAALLVLKKKADFIWGDPEDV